MSFYGGTFNFLRMARPTPNGERIAAAREAKGWNQEQLAVHAGLSAKTVWIAEKGGSVNRGTLKLIAYALGVNETDLLQTEGAA